VRNESRLWFLYYSKSGPYYQSVSFWHSALLEQYLTRKHYLLRPIQAGSLLSDNLDKFVWNRINRRIQLQKLQRNKRSMERVTRLEWLYHVHNQNRSWCVASFKFQIQCKALYATLANSNSCKRGFLHIGNTASRGLLGWGKYWTDHWSSLFMDWILKQLVVFYGRTYANSYEQIGSLAWIQLKSSKCKRKVSSYYAQLVVP